jgi:hypothetical protein
VTGERTRDSVTFEQLGRRRGREGKKRGERGGGPTVGVPRGAGAVPRPCPGRLRPRRGARGWRVSVSDRSAPRQLTAGPGGSGSTWAARLCFGI